jgi:hypothetical protein
VGRDETSPYTTCSSSKYLVNTPYQPQQLRTLIKSTLDPFQLWSPKSEELLVATCANESHLGVYRKQVNGPALGIFQCEPNTFNDIYANYLRWHQGLLIDTNMLSKVRTVEDLEFNDPYAVMICRLQYFRVAQPLPEADDIEAIFQFYKIHYNSINGKATHDQFIYNYNTYVKS